MLFYRVKESSGFTNICDADDGHVITTLYANELYPFHIAKLKFSKQILKEHFEKVDVDLSRTKIVNGCIFEF